jgi:hypothetical protein
LKKQRDFLDKEAVSFYILEARDSRTNVQDDIRERQRVAMKTIEQDERNTRIAHLRHSISWLSIDSTKEQESNLERLSSRRHDETCEWIEHNPQMKRWMHNDVKQPVLWLSGKPGAGLFLKHPFTKLAKGL